MKHWLIAVVLGILWVPPTARANEALTNEDIVTLTEAGFGPSVIVAKIVSSSTAFDTSVVALVALADKGVSEEVVAAMVAADGSPAPDSADPQSFTTSEITYPTPTPAPMALTFQELFSDLSSILITC